MSPPKAILQSAVTMVVLVVPTEYGNAYNGPNVGGGVNLWFARRTALRVEYLHVVQTLSGEASTENHNLFRVGVTWR